MPEITESEQEQPTFRTAEVDETVRGWLSAAVRAAALKKREPGWIGFHELYEALLSARDPWAQAWKSAGANPKADADELLELTPGEWARILGLHGVEHLEGLHDGELLTDEDLKSLELRPSFETALETAARVGDGTVVAWAFGLKLLLSELPALFRKDAASRYFRATVEIRFGEGQVVELRRGIDEGWWHALGPETPAVVVAFMEDRHPLPSELTSTRPSTHPVTFEWGSETFQDCPVLWMSPAITAEQVAEAWQEAPPGLVPTTPWVCPMASEGFEAERLRAVLDGLRQVRNFHLLVDSPQQAEHQLKELRASSASLSPDPFAVALAHLSSRGRAAEAHPAVSDRPRGEDQLDTTPIAQALAWTLALEDTSTPLCVGIFGSWGSGKSFLMRQIADQLVERDGRAPTGLQERFVDQVRVVTFNAWTYAKGDLWSAILFEILSALRDQRDLPQATRLEKVVKARQELAEKKSELAEKKSKLESAQEEAERTLSASETLERLYRHRVDVLEQEVEQARRDVSTVRSQALLAGAKVLLPWIEDKDQRRWGLFLLALLGVGLLAGVLALSNWDGLQPTVRQLSTVVAAVGGVLTLITGPARRALEVARPVWKAFEEARKKLQDRVREAETRWGEIEKEVDTLRREELGKAKTEVTRVEGEVRRAQTRLDQALATYGTPVARRDLKEFLRARLEEGDYLERLGPLQQVEQDLRELAVILATVQKKKAESEETSEEGDDAEATAATGRIVLMIDDLDRCPPDKVVVVLEAIQLLLAENVYLEKAAWPFVVVLGADTRVLTRALESHYEGILSPWESPTGLDYLEKIIQIPYRVPAVREDRYTSYLEKLTGLRLAGQDGAMSEETVSPHGGDTDPPGGDEVEPLPPVVWDLESDQPLLTGEDLEILDRYKALAPDHPRGIKRVLNQYRLAKVLGLRTGRFAPAETAFLLNLAGGFPWTAREMVARLEIAEEGQEPTVDQLVEEIGAGQGSSTSGTGSGRYRPIAEEVRSLKPRIKQLQANLPEPHRLRTVLPDIAPFCFVSTGRPPLSS